ncbi:serine/threonine protein kinase [Arthrobacter sp. CDRTa11]|uniref:serine/threonine-protein kinase n=1 Tax=Arthrobacter sp. CDRTa11 TaxID=2651199 RepID=UPI002265A6CB|nr:serine/threonine-protein kinase [Arthrobacter sp. CDRTa11]UZX05129.1 serine/threonine protein kinase [Arthrobacter sp. CDRTa11]
MKDTDTGMQGTVLQERYRVGDVLGQGGMGTVYRGTDLALGRDVALKIFRADVADAAELSRQQSEVRLLARLNHHGLVTLFDAGSLVQGQRDVPFLVMELIPGVDLHRHLKAGPLTGMEAARIGAELSEALQYIHHHEVVHRDVKPANILLARYGSDATVRAKLADFGIARMLDGTRHTATNMIPGTAAYLSPEQASGEPVGPPADIYSLGLVLLEALTGKVEFPGPPLEAAVARLSRSPVVPAELGNRWKPLLTAMTARDPAMRPDAGTIATALHDGGDWATLSGPMDPADAVETPGPQGTLVLGASQGQSPAAAPGGWEGGVLPALASSEITNATSWRPASPQPPTRKPAAVPREQGPQRRWGKLLRNTGRQQLWILGALVVAVAVFIAIVLLNSVPSSDPGPANAPDPVIPGQMGEHFKELEESVKP